MTDFAPCPTCGQYRHSISDDKITEAFNWFQSMGSAGHKAYPIHHNFDAQTRECAQVLVEELKSIRAERDEARAEVERLCTARVDLKELARIPALEAEVERLAKDLKSSEEEASWAEDDAVETANSLDKALAEVAFLTARLDEAEKEAAYLRDVVAAWKQIAG